MCGPVSIGTVAVIRLVSRHAHVGLAEAANFVDRCVFDGQTISIPISSAEEAELLVRALRSLPAIPKIEAVVEADACAGNA
jgi:hypothetical protein